MLRIERLHQNTPELHSWRRPRHWGERLSGDRRETAGRVGEDQLHRAQPATAKPERDMEPSYIMKRTINKNEYCQRELGKVRGLEMARAGGERSAADCVRQEANAQKIDWLASAIASMDGISVAAKKLKVSRATIYHWLDEGLARASLETVVAIGREGNTPIEYLIRRIGPFKPIGTTTRYSANGIQRSIRGGQR